MTTRLLPLLLLLFSTLAPAASATSSPATSYPSTIELPAGFAPEDLTSGRGPDFYVGSLSGAGVYTGSFRTGEGRILVPGESGRADAGLFVDRRNRLWVSGAAAGDVRVYDAVTGAPLAEYKVDALGAFTTDLVVTQTAAYVTDSNNQRIYVIPLGPNLRLPSSSAAVKVLPLTGDITYTDEPNAFNTNGIVERRGQLLIGQLNAGKLFTVEPQTGRARQVDLGGAILFGADGLTLRGDKLYVTQNIPQTVTVIELSGDMSSGRVVERITDPRFDVPTSNTVFSDGLYVLNSRVLSPVTPTTTYSILRFARP